MEEEIKAIRTMREFILWYEKNYLEVKPQELSLQLNEFYRKFSYILKQDEEENIMMGKLLG